MLQIQEKQTEILYVGGVELYIVTFTCPELLNTLQKGFKNNIWNVCCTKIEL